MIAPPPWLDILDHTIGACATHQRPDLAHRLRQRRARLLDRQLRVLVVGEPNQGKSQLINALINAAVCAVGDDLTTTAPTVVQHADPPSASLVTDPGAGPRALTPPGVRATSPERVAVSIDEVSRQVSGRAGAIHRGELVRAEIGIPRKLLASGLVLIDTPPVGDLRSAGAARTFAALEQADTVLLTSDVTTELSASELDLLVRVVKSCPNVIVALTKIDLSPHWRQVADRNRAVLAAAQVPARLIPVSATLRLQAARTGDQQINAESGFGDLIGCLQREVLTKSEQVAPRSVAVITSSTIAQLVTALRGRLSGADTPQAAAAAAKMAEAQQQMDALRKRTTRWQTRVGDEMADLVSDVEHDLRDRTRAILREVDRVFDESDPAVSWDTFADWLTQNLIEAADANFAWLLDRCRWLADKVAAEFPPATSRFDALDPDGIVALPSDPRPDLARLEGPRLERFNLGQKAFTGLRGSYGGVLMFGLITSLAQLPLINPISLSAGVAFGGKTIWDEAEGRLKRRQAVAKGAAQRYIDDVFLACSKESKDLSRRVQRALRDHVTARAEAGQDEITESARQVRLAAQSDAASRDRTNLHVRQALEKLVVLHGRVQELASAKSALPAAGGLELTAS
ncbi:MAG TPA: dynamin family protein [Pseudonocardiaceae bacterium]|nr:dynamin family protein [Pseudonocardiaceae bacterium]